MVNWGERDPILFLDIIYELHDDTVHWFWIMRLLPYSPYSAYFMESIEKTDKLAKKCISMQIAKIKIPYTDFKRKIAQLLRWEWQKEWDPNQHNKLYEH